MHSCSPLMCLLYQSLLSSCSMALSLWSRSSSVSNSGATRIGSFTPHSRCTNMYAMLVPGFYMQRFHDVLPVAAQQLLHEYNVLKAVKDAGILSRRTRAARQHSRLVSAQTTRMSQAYAMQYSDSLHTGLNRGNTAAGPGRLWQHEADKGIAMKQAG